MRWIPLVLIAGLAACQPLPEPVSEPPLEGTCGAEGLQGLVGQPASTLDTMRFANPLRVIGPDDMVTMDFRPDRLNIETDAAGRITRVRCG